MNARGKSYKTNSTDRISVLLSDSNVRKLQHYQKQLQESRDRKVSASAIINECIHNYLKDEV